MPLSKAVTTSSAGSSVTVADGGLSNASGIVVLNMPIGSGGSGIFLTAGDYWLGWVGASKVTTNAGTALTLASLSNVVLTNYNSGLMRLGQTATATSITLVPGNGAFTAQTGAFPTAIPIVSVSNNSNASLYGNFMNVSM